VRKKILVRNSRAKYVEEDVEKILIPRPMPPSGSALLSIASIMQLSFAVRA
jgi:hypothetical protein